jgi:hypothetical protein
MSRRDRYNARKETSPVTPQMVQVEWLDACGYMGEYLSEAGLVPGDPTAVGIIHRTVGWKVRDDKSGVIIALTQAVGSDGRPNHHRMCVEIPRAYVRKVRILK